MEGNEMNVFVHTHPENEKDDIAHDNISRYNKGGFRHFVEESTLRNVSLDELEELSDPGCASGVDGNIRRTPSTVSSEQPVRFAIVVEWQRNYINSWDGKYRFAILVCSTISLVFLSNAGNEKIDILDFPFAPEIRAHIFVTLLTILISLAFIILEITSIIDCFPLDWNIIDAVLHACLCGLMLFTSVFIVYAEIHVDRLHWPVGEWTLLYLSFSMIFGHLSWILLFFFVGRRCCTRNSSPISDDIVLTTLTASS